MWTTIAALMMVVNASPIQNPPVRTADLDIRQSVLSSKSMFLPPVQQPAPGSRGWTRRHPVMFGAVVGARAVARPAPALSPSAFRGGSTFGSGSRQRRSWVQRHPVWLGIGVGGAVGAAWGSTQYVEGTDAIGGRGGMTLFGAGIGAGVGALGGFLVGLATK